MLCVMWDAVHMLNRFDALTVERHPFPTHDHRLLAAAFHNDVEENSQMTHVIFDLCIRDGACAEVCPVECIVPGQPEDEWPWYYIDPDTCIDCGACVPECPVLAILPEEDLPEEQQYTTELNALFFTVGPGYAALGK